MQIKFNYVVFFYMVVDVHTEYFHNNQLLQYFQYHTVVMVNHMNMNDMYYCEEKREVYPREEFIRHTDYRNCLESL
jgi:hypothetical protein